MTLAYVDANVILRFLTGDPPEMAAQARALFEAAERGELTLRVEDIVIAEAVWVLQSFYRHPPAEIGRVLQELLSREGFEAADKPSLLAALALYAGKHVDFADALVAAHMAREGVGEIYSFDQHFDRLPGIKRQRM